MPKKQISLNLEDGTRAKIAELAEFWGFPPVRHNTPVISEAIDRIHKSLSFEMQKGEIKLNQPQREP